LPATVHRRVRQNRVGLPVMWLRHAHGKMRRDGVPAADLQQLYAVNERETLHGASGRAVSQRGVVKRASEDLVVAEEMIDNG
jgi:hypothetical protein